MPSTIVHSLATFAPRKGSTLTIHLDEFIPAIQRAIPRFNRASCGISAPDPQQQKCILHAPSIPLQIVAGPGSGKTTVLVLRALRLMLVEGILPEQILITTFTKKAASEIRTRLIEWGSRLIDDLQQTGSASVLATLKRIDINRFVTGTLDSVCEEALRTMRAATDVPPSLLDGFAVNAIMHRRGLTGTVFCGGVIHPSVANYLAQFSFDDSEPTTVASLVRSVRPLFDRFSHDLIDLEQFRNMPSHREGRRRLADGYEAYIRFLKDTNRIDFALLERTFLDRLRHGRLKRFVEHISAILVDEYQDTNLLQESIYFEIFRRSDSSLTVVGDDDQSLYRFRGATVELFRDFRTRLTQATQLETARIDLIGNYRSTPEIVDFFNSFIVNDPDFSSARVHPPKPRIEARRDTKGVPVLGMFRESLDRLAGDLSDFLFSVFRGSGYKIPNTTCPATICSAEDDGDFGDAVLLCHSAAEFKEKYGNKPAKPRLPYMLRQKLALRGVRVFNPRGQALRDIMDIRRLLGAMLEALDPQGKRQNSLRLKSKTIHYLNEFRDAYLTFSRTSPHPRTPHSMSTFVTAWGDRRVQGSGNWPSEWPLLELCFSLLSWFPSLREDPEGQVHIEAIARTISQAVTFSRFRGLVVHGSNARHQRYSVECAIRDIFAPLADDAIDPDEEIMPSVPRDRLSIMTIHQAKGLEYPMVIVDVSSDFKTNHHNSRFRRFPERPSRVTLAEDDLASVCTIGTLRQRRTALQRTFEDLIRLYYVAFSRPQSVLLLVGHDSSLRYSSTVKNIGTFWRTDESWPWITSYTTEKAPALANYIPMELV